MGMLLFVKAQIPGGAGADLFAMPVQVAGHTRGGTYVAPFASTRKKRIERPEMSEAVADHTAAEVFDHNAAWKRAYGKNPPSGSRAGMINAWANEHKRKLTYQEEGAILAAMQRHIERAQAAVQKPVALALPLARIEADIVARTLP